MLCEVTTNVLWGLLAWRPASPRSRRRWSTASGTSERGLFLDEAQPGGRRPAVETWAALAPLALPDLPEAIGRRLVEEHLLDPSALLAPGPAALGLRRRADLRARRRTRGLVRRYWRGPTWVNSAWLVWLGLRRLGYAEPAQRMADALSEIVSREGLREYYDPRTGAGLGATDFAWTSLVMELADPDPASAASHV